MKSLITFRISELQSIQIVINEQNKINTYGYKTEELHVFDEVEVEYIYGNQTIILAKDIVQHIITTFSTALEKSLENKLSLDTSFTIGKMGYFFSKKMYMSVQYSEKKDDIFSKYWVWSSPDNIQTWLYNLDNKIYLEISQTYPWIFSDPNENERYISFDEYTNNYQPILILELQKSIIQAWIKQCQIALQEMKT